MKNIFIILTIFFSGYFHINAQRDNNENLYSYKDYFINLDNLQVIQSQENFSNTFKISGIYSGRFNIPFWFESYPKEVIYKNKFFQLSEDNIVKIIDLDTKEEKILKNMEDGIDLDFTSGNSFLLSTSNGVLQIKKLISEYGFIIYKYDENGHILFNLNLEHTDIIVEGNIHHSYPYLAYLMNTDDYIVFSSYDRNYDLTYLIDLNNGEFKSYDYTVSGVIRAEDENTIIGFVVINEENIRVDLFSYEWTTFLNNNYSNAVQTLVKDNILVIADYNTIATGSNLSAYDLNTGNFLWEADVNQLNVGHSKYYNTVILSLYEDKVIMEGIEAYGSYIQIFDINNGERLFTSDDF